MLTHKFLARLALLLSEVQLWRQKKKKALPPSHETTQRGGPPASQPRRHFFKAELKVAKTRTLLKHRSPPGRGGTNPHRRLPGQAPGLPAPSRDTARLVARESVTGAGSTLAVKRKLKNKEKKRAMGT